jgi:hypothetical protein
MAVVTPLVVVIAEGNEYSPRGPDADVTGKRGAAARGFVVVEIEIARRATGGCKMLDVGALMFAGGAVVHEDQFKLSVGLATDGSERCTERDGAIAGCDDYGDKHKAPC